MTISATDFNVRNLIRQVVGDLGTIDHAAIAEMVAVQVPEQYLREALEQALRPLVHEIIRMDRPRGPVGRQSSPAQPAPAPVFAPARPRQVVGDGAPSPAYSGSRKGNEIRDAWQRVLKVPYATAHGQKRLGDLTYDDLYFVAGKLDELAEQNRARARGFREIAALLTDHDVETVRDLPTEVLAQTLGAK